MTRRQGHGRDLAAYGFVREEGLHFPLTRKEVSSTVAMALEEDDTKHDLTTAATVLSDRRARCRLVARQTGVIAGLPLACEAFQQLDKAVTMRIDRDDGSKVEEATPVMFLSGHAHGLLSAERVALNFLQRLSGIATLTARYVEAVAGTGAHILDTRKTTPGWRRLEKYAVRAGGGRNHRFGLDDAVLIKDNHIAFAGGLLAALERARGGVGHLVKIEVEVDTLEQLEEALGLGVDAVLLDNMDPATLRRAVAMAKGRALTEASGGIRPETAAAIAATGVDLLSVGWLTHSSPALDVALDLEV
jgi:nicotinate-nucleotide pyrophosphorylase (carboxylating)